MLCEIGTMCDIRGQKGRTRCVGSAGLHQHQQQLQQCGAGPVVHASQTNDPPAPACLQGGRVHLLPATQTSKTPHPPSRAGNPSKQHHSPGRRVCSSAGSRETTAGLLRCMAQTASAACKQRRRRAARHTYGLPRAPFLWRSRSQATPLAPKQTALPLIPLSPCSATAAQVVKPPSLAAHPVAALSPVLSHCCCASLVRRMTGMRSCSHSSRLLASAERKRGAHKLSCQVCCTRAGAQPLQLLAGVCNR